MVFVQGVCPGERVVARVIRVQPRFAEAEVETVAESAPCRIEPVCRVPGPDGHWVRVPGCVYDHLAYPAEVAAKQRQLADFLARQARVDGVDALLAAPCPSPSDLHYRNKMVLHAGFNGGRFGLGYRGDDNRSVVDIPACPLALPGINAALADLRADARFPGNLRPDEDVTFRWTPADGPVVWSGNAPRNAARLRERLAWGEVEVPLDGFFQVNPAVGGRLVDAVAEWVRVDPPKALIDLYCGVGVFGFAAARQGVGRVLGVETGRAAVAAARDNARRLGLAAEFGCMSAAEGLASAWDELRGQAPWVVVDPPRDGLEPEVRSLLARLRPGRLLYISCAPDTLARDIRFLVEEGGFRVRSAQLFDLFPRTAHFETLVAFDSGNGNP